MTRTKDPKNQETRIILIAIIALLHVLASSASVKSELNIILINQSDLVEFGSTQVVLVSVASTSNISFAKIEINGQNYSMQGIGNYTYSWIPSRPGDNRYSIYSSNLENASALFQGNFFVSDTIAPQIIGFGPNSMISSNPIELTAMTNEDATCKYDTSDISYESMRYALPGALRVHSEVKTLPDSSYTYYVRCKDLAGNTGSSKKISFILDTNSPQINIVSPTGIVTNNPAYLRVSTNEQASCSISTSSNGSFALLSITGSTLHETQLTLNDGINSYFVNCIDSAGNSRLSLFNLEFNSLPKASIDILSPDGFDWLKEGTYLVKIQTSESLSQTPSLLISCPGVLNGIGLQGSGSSWEGYLVIGAWGRCAGEFRFSGIDLKGSSGSEITSGKLIQIDTVKPIVPSGIKLSLEEKKVKISWSGLSENIKQYNIYRSTTGNTDKNNLRYATPQTVFLDADVSGKTGYFYRVSAVSKSGLESDLSEEVFIMVNIAENDTFKQDKKITDLVNAKIAELESIIASIDKTKNSFENPSSSGVGALVKKKNLISELDASKLNIQLLVGELKGYLSTKISLSDLNANIKIIDSKMEGYKKNILDELVVKEEFSVDQDIDIAQMNKSINEFIKSEAMSGTQKEAYSVKALGIYEKIRITKEIVSYNLFYMDGSKKDGFIVVEKLVIPDVLKDSLNVQEIILRGSIKASELSFLVEPKDINYQGPIWKLSDLPNDELIYEVGGLVNFSLIKGIDTIPLPGLDSFLMESAASGNSSGLITGNVVESERSGGGGVIFYITLVAGLVLIGLLVYYLVSMGSGKKAGSAVVSDGSVYARIIELVGKSRVAINSGDVNLAVSYYSEAKELYGSSKFSLVKRLKLNLELNRLYDELMVKVL